MNAVLGRVKDSVVVLDALKAYLKRGD